MLPTGAFPHYVAPVTGLIVLLGVQALRQARLYRWHGVPVGRAYVRALAVTYLVLIALSVMAIELMGAGVLPHVVVVTIVAYLLSGHRGIYPSQRLLRRKSGGSLLRRPVALRDFRDSAPPSGPAEPPDAP